MFAAQPIELVKHNNQFRDRLVRLLKHATDLPWAYVLLKVEPLVERVLLPCGLRGLTKNRDFKANTLSHTLANVSLGLAVGFTRFGLKGGQ